jgi:protein-tyrosine phosphatase
MQDRIKPLDGVLNFRDFGGYATASGGEVVRGKLFRTASFAEATERDMSWLSQLGAKFVVDLRRPEERTDAPNLWPGEGLRVVTNDDGYKELPAHVGVLTQTDLTAESVRDYMRTAYTHYPYEPRYVELFKAWLHGLADEGGPAIVHCAAGKDRTGVACMLVLTALGVDHETIVADYELTNVAVDLDKRMPMIRERMAARMGREISEEAIRPMLGVHVDYLNAAIDAMEDRHGDIPSYMNAVLGVDEAMTERLRQHFVR